MRIQDSVETGLHACLLLAAAPDGRGLSAARLAEFHALSPTSIAKQMQELAAAGIVRGSAGRTGGYRLARPAADVTVLEVVEALDGAGPGFRCREIRRRGPCTGPDASYSPICAVAGAMHRAEAAWREELGRTTLADLGRGLEGELDPGIVHRSASWMQEAAR
jgi:Rrf2 family protein